MLGEQRHDADDDDDLTPEERQAKEDQKTHEELAAAADSTLNRWHENAPEETRQAVIEAYVAGGELDAVAAGVDEVEVMVVTTAFTQHIERSILQPLGLTMDKWSEHIDEADLPEFRRAVIRGDWALLTQHAQAAASMRHKLGI